MYGYDHYMWGGGWWMIIIAIAVIVIVFWGANSLFGLGQGLGSGHNGQPSALEILKRRYASGEINKEEFDRIKKDLMG